jgi:HK97 family phage portal protein
MNNWLMRARRWIGTKLPTFDVTSSERGETSESGYIDPWNTTRPPTDNELIQGYRETAFACANLNAQGMASLRLRLYSTVRPAGERFAHRAVSRAETKRLDSLAYTPNIKQADSLRELATHPVLDLLSRVNVRMTSFDLLEITDLYQEILGQAYWYIELDPALNIPSAIWVLNPMLVTRRIDRRSGTTAALYYGVGQNKTELPVDQIVEFHFPNLADPYGDGWPPLRACWQTYSTQSAAHSYTTAMLENRNRPDMAIIPKQQGGWSTGTRRRIERELRQRFSRSGNGRTIIMQGDADVKPLSFPSKDLEMVALYNLSKEGVANAFGVPVSKLKTESVNRANAEAGNYSHARDAILPRSIRFAAALTQNLLRFYDERLFFAFDDPVPENEDRALRREAIHLKQNVITINEARAEIGRSETGWGDEPLVNANLVPISTIMEFAAPVAANPAPGQAASPEPETKAPAQTKPQTKPQPRRDDESYSECVERVIPWLIENEDMDRNQAVAYAHEFCRRQAATQVRRVTLDALREGAITDETADKLLADAGIGATERALLLDTSTAWIAELHHCSDGPNAKRMVPEGLDLARELRDRFAEQRQTVLRGVSRIMGGKAAAANGDNLPTRAKIYFLDEDEATKRLADATSPFIEARFAEGVRDFLVRSGTEDVLTGIDMPEVRREARRLSLDFCKATNETTNLKLREALDRTRQEIEANLIDPDAGVDQLTKRVNQIFDQAETWRARRIAQTETSRALHAGEREQAKRSGIVVGFRWILSQDACPICQRIESQTSDGIGVDERFGEVGDNPEYRDVYHPPAHPNCRCSLEEIIDDQAVESLRETSREPSAEDE